MRNLVEHGLSRLAFQFEQSEKLKSLISTSLDEFQTLDNTFNDLLDDRLLLSAVGVQLDGLGILLGLPRPYLPVDVIDAFGFFEDPTALGFGDINNPAVGGHFVDYANTKEAADDELYRKILRAKAVINSSSMTAAETARMISLMFDGVRVKYALTLNLHPRYTILKLLTSAEISLLNLLPVLLGLGRVTYVAVDEAGGFGFLDDPDSQGFTDINNTELGGRFAIII